MENCNVTFRKVVFATLRADNKDNADRTYDISADINVVGGEVDNIQNGVAMSRDDSGAVCEFSANNTPNLRTSFSNMDNIEDQAEALRAVADFIAAAKSKAPILSPANE